MKPSLQKKQGAGKEIPVFDCDVIVNAKLNEVAIELIEITCESWKRAK